jgi:hypothetical protein
MPHRHDIIIHIAGTLCSRCPEAIAGAAAAAGR